MKKLLRVVMMAMVISGCATTPMVWYKTGVTQQEFKRDNYECTQQSRTQWSGGGSGLIGLGMIAGSQMSAQSQANQLYRMCMDSKGYTSDTAMATTGIIGPNKAEPQAELIVRGLVPNSPAEKAGIKTGDKILAKNGIPVKTAGDLLSLPQLQIGEQVEYTITRDGKEFTVRMIAVSVSSLRGK